MNKTITDFLDKQRCATICCLDDENHPYCFTVLYVFDKVKCRLYFKSSSSSHHAEYLLKNKMVAGTIVPDKLNMLALRGIQFTGFVVHDSHEADHYDVAEYHRRFPLALTMPGNVWAIQLQTIKMTDNTIGFGKKIHWQREDLYEELY